MEQLSTVLPFKRRPSPASASGRLGTMGWGAAGMSWWLYRVSGYLSPGLELKKVMVLAEAIQVLSLCSNRGDTKT